MTSPTGSLPTIDHAPLDRVAMEHAVALVEAKHCARQVIVSGKLEYISYIGIGDKGGRVEVQAYLAGDTKVYDAAELKLAPAANMKATKP